MKYYQNTFDFQIQEPCALSLGKFDGLHTGHKALMREITAAQDRGLTSVALTFAVPPDIPDGRGYHVLSTRREKELIFSRAGVDVLIEMPFDDRIRNMDPVSFLRFLKERMNVKLIVAGTDFRFGYRRSGDSRTLQQYADAFGYSCVIVDKLVCEGAEISSTRIRTCVIEGKIELANRLLGYPYLIMGEVIHGEGVGRKGGFPTVNLRPDEQKLLPPNGVYFSTAEVDGTRYPAITNIGKKPTAGHFPVGVETYLLDFAGDLYGREVIIYLHCFRRPEQRFESFDALREQIGRDLDACRAYFLENPTEKSVDKLYFTQYN